MELRHAHGLDGVVFTAEDSEAVRQWVQDRAANSTIVASSTKLYLPVGETSMVEVLVGDTIFHDPDVAEVNAFTLDRA